MRDSKRDHDGYLPESVKSEVEKVVEVAGYLWQKGWAERNAGNISLRINSLVPDDFQFTERGNVVPCATLPAEAAGFILFVTGAGARLRDLIHRKEEVSCILRINNEANGYVLLWGGNAEGFRPTTELISHVQIQLFLQQHKPDHHAVLHTHCTELILLSHHPLFNDEEAFNHALWKLCPEIRVFVPLGISCTPYAVSGSDTLAKLSMEGLQNRDIILWEKHGVLATGKDIAEAFDFLDVANKGAEMLLKAWAAGFEPAGMNAQQMAELERLFLS